MVYALAPKSVKDNKEEFLARDENKNCLIRVYLRRRENRPSNAAILSTLAMQRRREAYSPTQYVGDHPSTVTIHQNYGSDLRPFGLASSYGTAQLNGSQH